MGKISSNNLTANELERANEVINQFINSCSHSMRGPLKSINGLVNLLHKSKDYSETEAITFLDLINKTTEKMENMLDELEQLLENSKRNISKKRIDWDKLIPDVLSRYQKEIDASDIKINMTTVEHEPFFSDYHRIYLILSHLIENAIQFQDPARSDPYITIATEVTNKNSTVKVSDNGIGIHEDAQEKVFHLFYRATQKSTGAGAGLYIVDEAVRKIGGTINVESVLGGGSMFTLNIPNLKPKENEKNYKRHSAKNLTSAD